MNTSSGFAAAAGLASLPLSWMARATVEPAATAATAKRAR
jgi:hypothetical protein